jgi:GNAT superfamily N-acetyltransferase
LQGCGIGRRILDRVTAAAREWAVEAIRVDTYDGAAGAAPFYEKCGFTEVGRKLYRGVPLVYLELVL